MKKDTVHRKHCSFSNIDDHIGGDGHVMVDKATIYQGYDNLAFDATNSDISFGFQAECGTAYVPQADGNQDGDDLKRMKRSISSASQLRLKRSPSLFGGSLPSHGQEFVNPSSPSLRNQIAVFYAGSSRSEFDGSTFSGAFTFPVRSQSELSLTFLLRTPGYHSNMERMFSLKPRSLMYLDEDDYLARPPPSRPVSMGYVNINQELQAQSGTHFRLRRRFRHRKATSLEVLNVREELSEVKLNEIGGKEIVVDQVDELIEGKCMEDVVL